MAIIVPILMTATGASAAIGAAVGVSAAMVTTITTVAFTVTGINDKINQAAGDVFGEDLVKIGNLFGAAYGAVSSGFGGLGDAAGATGSGLESVNGFDAMSDAYSGTGAGGFGSLADMGSAVAEGVNGFDSMSDAYTYSSETGPGGFGGSDAMSDMNGLDVESDAYTASHAPTNSIERTGVNPAQTANDTGKPQSLLPNTGSASAQASGVDAAGAKAAGTNAAGSQASAQVNGPGQVRTPAGGNTPAGGAAPRSFFDRLAFDEKGNLSRGAWQAIGGVGQGYADAQKQKAQRKVFDDQMAEERRRMNQSTGTRVTR